MIDIKNLTNADALSLDDFLFKVGNTDNPDTWTIAPRAKDFSVWKNAGEGGADRVVIVWEANVIQKQWLQVQVLPTSNTGLLTADVHYWGNAIGETGNSPGNAYVTAADEIDASNNPIILPSLAGIENRFDFDRNGFVNASDQLAARNNATTLSTALRLISV